MGLSICPAAVVAVPIESVWELLSEPIRYDEWWDARTQRIVPAGRPRLGRCSLRKLQHWAGNGTSLSGSEWSILKSPDAVHITLPLGIVNDATITCTALDLSSCRVQYG